MDYNKLCNQKLVDSIFIPIKTNYPNLKEELEEIEFVFKNACYNKNRMIEGIEYMNSGFHLNEKKLNKTMSNIKVVVPAVIWQDIIIFELHTFVTNIIRTINFLLKFKLNKWDGKSYISSPSIGKYFEKEEKKHEQEAFFKELKTSYERWIKRVNNIRNMVIHKYVAKKLQGDMVFDLTQKKGYFSNLSIREHEITDLRGYANETVENTKELLLDFFTKFKEYYKI